MKVMSALFSLARAAAFVDDCFPHIDADLAPGVYEGFFVDEDSSELAEDPPI